MLDKIAPWKRSAFSPRNGGLLSAYRVFDETQLVDESAYNLIRGIPLESSISGSNELTSLDL
uniref:Uncharacterized protein n=1 Tax=Arundo donax TaxID=35708 RepID=A0A0A8YM21_ARUDO